MSGALSANRVARAQRAARTVFVIGDAGIGVGDMIADAAWPAIVGHAAREHGIGTSVAADPTGRTVVLARGKAESRRFRAQHQPSADKDHERELRN